MRIRPKDLHLFLPRLKWLKVLLPVLFTVHVHGQDTTVVIPFSDSIPIEKFNNWFVLKLALINTSETLVTEASGYNNILKANPSQIMRVYVNYRFIAFYVNYIPHFLPGNNDNATKGKSKGIGFGTALNFKSLFTEMNFSRTKGYYLENTKDFRPDWKPGDPYFQIPDFYVTSFDGTTGYNTNPRYSLTATTSQTERQLKSAGAFIPKIAYRYYIIDNRTAVSTTTQRANQFYALLGAGYEHTLVLNKSLYLHGGFTPYFGYIWTRVLTRDPAGNYSFSQKGPIYHWNAKLGLGYNGHRFFAGSYLSAVSSKFAQGLTSAVRKDASLFLQVFAGIRLKAPKFIEKKMDKTPF